MKKILILTFFISMSLHQKASADLVFAPSVLSALTITVIVLGTLSGIGVLTLAGILADHKISADMKYHYLINLYSHLRHGASLPVHPGTLPPPTALQNISQGH